MLLEYPAMQFVLAFIVFAVAVPVVAIAIYILKRLFPDPRIGGKVWKRRS